MQTDYDTGTAHDTGQDVRAKTEETVSTLVDSATQVAETQATTQKDRAAETLGTVAQSIRDAGSGMREQQPQIASFAEQAASRVEDVSTFIRDHDVRDLVGEAERLARREPLLFLGGAFALGFVAARFLKASAPQGSGNGYGSDTGYNAYGSQFGARDTGRYTELTSGGSMYGGGGYGTPADETGSANGWSNQGTSTGDTARTEYGWAQDGDQAGVGTDYQGEDRTGRE